MVADRADRGQCVCRIIAVTVTAESTSASVHYVRISADRQRLPDKLRV